MSQRGNVEKLKLYESYWNDSGYTDENHLAAALLVRPDLISPVVTHLVGKAYDKFPLSFITEGSKNMKYINSEEYDYPVIGELDKSVPLAVAISSGSPGLGHTRFNMTFKERWFSKQYVLRSPKGYQVRVMEEPYADGLHWVYPVEMITDDNNDYVPLSEFAEGTLWSQMYAPVTHSGSRGNESNWTAPYRMRNQISTIRKSYRYEGNVQNKIMNVTMTLDGKQTNLWVEFEEFQHMLKWKEECEMSLWYSKYNRDSKGIVHMKDENGKPILMGAGIFDQIPNYDSYSAMTSRKLKETVRDLFYNCSDAEAVNITLYTGTGGMEEFDNAIKEDLASQTYVRVQDKFVDGSTRNLTYGNYFTTYRHIDGHTITVRKLPMLDYGPAARNSTPHPESGLPLESYKFIFLDQSTYDGESNIYQVTQKGREMLRWAVAGATIPKGFSGNSLRASDIDGGSVHMMKSAGICIRRATNCLVMECSRA